MADDEAEARHLMKLYGVTVPAGGPKTESPAAARSADPDTDAARLMKHYGVTFDPTAVAKEVLPPELSPKWGQPTPEGLALSKQRGFVQPIVEGIPIIGPTIDAVSSAGAAALAPHFGDVGDSTFFDRWSRNMGLTHEASRIYAEENPLKSFAGNMIGAAATYPLMAATGPGRLAMGLPTLRTPGFGGQFWSGVGGGAGINALDAGMRGHDPSTGAIIGGATGMMSPVLTSAFDAGGRFLYNQFGRIPDALRQFNPVAREHLSEAMRGGMNDPVGPHSFFGEATPGLTKIAQGISFGEDANASAVVRNAYHQRAAERPDRVNGYLDAAFGPRRNIVDDARLITEERARAADPLYEQWRTMQVHPTQGLKDLIPRLEKAGAFNMAEEISGVSGREMYRNFFTTGARKNYPTAEGWDMVKRGLDRRIDQLLRSEGGGELARELLRLKGEMLSEIRRTPAGAVWDQARDAFASRSTILDQLEAGRDTFVGGRHGTSVDELREELRHLSRPELMARINSARDVVSEAMGETGRGVTTTIDKLLAPNGRAKLELLLGRGRAHDMIAMLEHERQMGSTAEGKFRQVVGGSQTTSNTEAVNALKAPDVGDFWDFQFGRPSTYVPGVRQLAHTLNPTTVAQAARDQRYREAIAELAPRLVMPNTSPQAAALRAAIHGDLAQREAWMRGAARGSMGVNALLLQPGAEAFRLKTSYESKSPNSLVRAAN